MIISIKALVELVRMSSLFPSKWNTDDMHLEPSVTVIHTVQIGLETEPPSGPAIPVTDAEMSVSNILDAPNAISTDVSLLTAPNSDIVSGLTPRMEIFD